MPSVRVYLSGNASHDRVLQAFYDGCGASKELVKRWEYEPSDIAVIFGVYKSKVPISWPRGGIFQQQREKNLDVIVLETGYINRGDGENHYYAAGFNGLNGRADFKNRFMPHDRAAKLGIILQPYFGARGHIVLCGQVPWDASVDHVNHYDWLARTVKRIQKNTDRPIIFRPHPLAKLPPLEDCKYSTDSLVHDLLDAQAVVTFNSNSAVEALIEGVPVFANDEGSMVWNICNRDLRDLDFPVFPPDREQWLADLAYAQWTPAEMREGLAWKHLTGT